MSWYYAWRPYVPVARRRAQAATYAAKLAKKEGRQLAPVKIERRKIAGSFWGQAWCENLERYSDFANRLPRGRTYVRNGSVIDLQIARGQVKAIVSGSVIYHVTIGIKTLGRPVWNRIKQDCSQSIHSLIDLLQGRFDQGVMQRLTQRDGGLFPQPKEIAMDCSCPDGAGMCKHVAAVLYGIGARLDTAPELLFTLRNVDHLELISQAVATENLQRSLGAEGDQALAGSDLGELFGIELDKSDHSAQKPRRSRHSLSAAAPAAAVVNSPAGQASTTAASLKKPPRPKAAGTRKPRTRAALTRRAARAPK